MKTAMENDRHSFEFVNTEVKTECPYVDDSNLVCDPISIGINIQIKEELDLKWDATSADENDDSDNLREPTKDPLAVANTPQARNKCSKKHCAKHKVHQSWLEHCYYRAKCEYCPIKIYERSRHLLSHSFLECKDCGKKFKSIRGLGVHNSHCRLYNCEHCSYKTSRKYNLQYHILNKHRQKQVCEICKKTVPHYMSFHKHWSLKCTVFKCDNCLYQTNQKKRIRRHIFKFHMTKDGTTRSCYSQNYDFRPCPRCGKIYKNKDVVKAHLQYCQKKFIHCLYCPYKTQRPYLLRKHVSTSHVKSHTDKVCSRCGEILKDESTRRTHSFACPQKISILCNYCTFKAQGSLYLKEHLLKLHCKLLQAKYECPKCSLKLLTSQTFRSHLSDCFANASVKCQECDYETKEPLNLTKHVLKMHLKKKISCRIPCSNCGNTLKSLKSYKRHTSYCEQSGKEQKGRLHKK